MRTSIERTIALAVAATGLGAALAAPAGAASGPRVAVDPAGTAHLSWLRSDGGKLLVQGRSRTADGTLGNTEYVSPGTDFSVAARVVAPAAGVALHTWYDPTTGLGRMRRRSADGTLGPVQSLTEPGAIEAPKAAVDDDGNTVFVWTRNVAGKMVIETRRRAANGTLSSVKRLSAAAPTYSALGPDVAVDNAGNAIVVWTVAAPTPYIQLRRRAADGTLTATQNLTSGARSEVPDVGVDGAGNAVVAFRRLKDGGHVVQVRRRSAAGALSPIQDLSDPQPVVLTPAVAVSPSAGAVVAWAEPAPGGSLVRVAGRPPGGSWTEAETVSPSAVDSTSVRLGIDAAGNAVVGWRRALAEASYLQVRRRTAAGTLSTVQELTPTDGKVAADYDLGVEPGGGAVAVWLAKVGEAEQVHVRRRTAAGELSQTGVVSY